MANTYVNKVQLADGTSLIDISDSTVTADKILQGYTAYGADGAKLTGTATGGGGSVTQDQDGYIVLPPDGGGSPSVSGLEYETGTWTPSEDVASYVIPFANTHTTAPFWYMIADATGTNISTTYTNYAVFYQNYHQVFGESNCAEGGTAEYGYVAMRYLPSGTLFSGSSVALNEPFTSSASSANTKPRYWATETGIKAYTISTSRYWRAGRTYKWIAAWTPTT